MSRRLLLLFIVGLLAVTVTTAQTCAFTVTPEPAANRFHVVFTVSGPVGAVQDFEMPAWMPGYYRLMNYAQYVSDFRAQDAAGHDLAWEQVTPHTWRVVTAKTTEVELSYDVAATRSFAADNSIAADRAFIAPPGMFLYLPGRLSLPVALTLKMPSDWHEVATGLAPVSGRADTFTAPNFDVLFDSPLLLGNQEQLHFSVRGVPHTIAVEDVPASVDRQKMAADLQRIVAAATDLMGTVPYARYTFLMMGRGTRHRIPESPRVYLRAQAMMLVGFGLIPDPFYLFAGFFQAAVPSSTLRSAIFSSLGSSRLPSTTSWERAMPVLG